MASKEIILRDRNHKPIAAIEIKDNGDKVLRDMNHNRRPIGYYDKLTDSTRDINHRIIGYGDILTSLL